MKILKKITAIIFCTAILGCSAFDDPPPPCPHIAIDRDTADLTVFRKGTGRDITDRELDVKIQSYNGTCQYNDERDKVSLALNVKFSAEIGPAAEKREGKFSYFVAIPQFFPKKEGKKVLPIKLVFPPGADRIYYRDEEVRIQIPLKKGKTGKDYDVYIGLQTSKEQLDYNRHKRID